MNNLLTRLILLFIILGLHAGGFILFAKGFFPKKLLLPGHGQYYPDPDHSHFPQPIFNKLVFVVIDALRSDFMFGPDSNMPGVHNLVNSGYGIPFTAFSTPPTVTLPRIKGLTTGSTPNFLDAILNIAESDTSSTLSGQDSWLYQLKIKGKTIHMFGDDTWIKLFPDIFDVTEGTASFFVSDFTEVDNNVTRHLPEQLSPGSPWDVLILHYLGLDHIGHKGGPLSPFMPGKQEEMDKIIKHIFDAVADDTLLVVAGDHGMNEGGNHGGSSSGETSAGMIMLSKKFKAIPSEYHAPAEKSDLEYQYFNRIQQADLIPSLAALLDFPIPRNSLGVLPEQLLPLWSANDRSKVLEQNSRQIASILEASYDLPNNIPTDNLDNLSHIQRISLLWHQLTAGPGKFANSELCYDFLYECQSLLSRASSTYKVNYMIIGLVLETLAAIISIGCLVTVDFSKKLKFISLLLSGIYFCTMFASSLVEEEHQFWYWAVTGCLSWIYVVSARKGFKNSNHWIVCLGLIRVIRGWNQTGQKYAGAPDIVKHLTTPDNGIILWLMIMAYYSFLLVKTWNGTGLGLKFVASIVTVLASFIFKVNMAVANAEEVPSFLQAAVGSEIDSPGRLVQLARLSFITVGGFLFYELSEVFLQPDGSERSITKISYLAEVFLATQTRTYNIPLFIFFNFLRSYLQTAMSSNRVDSRDATALLVVFVLILQHVSFFAFGGSNSLASVDISNAYNGIESYNIGFVGILTYVSNWIGPLYWSMAGLSMLFESRVEGLQMVKRNDIMSIRIFLTQSFFSIAAIGIMGACIALKEHLFIWTVFSPKLLYAAAWLLIQNGLIDTVLTLIIVVALR